MLEFELGEYVIVPPVSLFRKYKEFSPIFFCILLQSCTVQTSAALKRCTVSVPFCKYASPANARATAVSIRLSGRRPSSVRCTRRSTDRDGQPQDPHASASERYTISSGADWRRPRLLNTSNAICVIKVYVDKEEIL